MPTKFIFGYPSASAVIQGFVRGDGQSSMEAVGSVQSEIVGRQAIPVIQTASPVKGSNGYSVMRTVPMLAKFAASDPPKTKSGKAELAELESLAALGSIYFSPVGTPAKYEAALSDALAWAETRTGAENQDIQDGIRPGTVLGTVLRNALIKVVKQQPELTKWLVSGA